MKIRLDAKSVAIGAVALIAVMIVPKVGDVVANGIGFLRDKIAGR